MEGPNGVHCTLNCKDFYNIGDYSIGIHVPILSISLEECLQERKLIYRVVKKSTDFRFP